MCIYVGVKGLILNEHSQAIPSTEVMIDNRKPTVKVTALGEFWRILLPGTYTLKVSILLVLLIDIIEYRFRFSLVVFKSINNQSQSMTVRYR